MGGGAVRAVGPPAVAKGVNSGWTMPLGLHSLPAKGGGMSQHILSVILTTHLRSGLLRRAIASVTALGEGVQIVLCADETSAQTRAVAAQDLRDQDVFVCAPHLRGPSQTRNLGITLASGAYAMFLDDDDTLDPSLGAVLPLLRPDSVLYANYRKIFEDRTQPVIAPLRQVEKNTARKPIATIMAKNFLPVGSYITPTALLAPLRFRGDLTSSEDWEFLLHLYQRAPFRHVALTIYNWHITEAEASRDKVRRQVRAQNCRAIYACHPVADPAILAARQARLAELGDHGPLDF